MASKATKRSHSKIPFTKFMLWLSTFRCVYLCHFWIARGWLFVDPSMDSGILKHSNRSQNARQRPFFLRPQSVCLVGHTDSGGWILVNMASYYTWIRYFFIISAWSGTKIPIHLRKQQSPWPPLEKPCTLWESLFKSVHFFWGGHNSQLAWKKQRQKSSPFTAPWLPQLGLEVWDLIFYQKLPIVSVAWGDLQNPARLPTQIHPGAECKLHASKNRSQIGSNRIISQFFRLTFVWNRYTEVPNSPKTRMINGVLLLVFPCPNA